MDKNKFTNTGDGAIRVKAQYDGTSLNKNTDEGKEPGPVKPKSIVDADPYGIYDNSEHNVAARETEGTVEEQEKRRKEAIKSGRTTIYNNPK